MLRQDGVVEVKTDAVGSVGETRYPHPRALTHPTKVPCPPLPTPCKKDPDYEGVMAKQSHDPFFATWRIGMARVKIEDVVYHLDSEFKKALDDTMAKFAPTAAYNRNELFGFFLKRVYHHCSAWENVPDGCVEA